MNCPFHHRVRCCKEKKSKERDFLMGVGGAQGGPF